MNTLELNPSMELNPSIALAEEAAKGKKTSVLKKINAFAGKQDHKRTGWFMASILAQGVLLLPAPAVLLYYYHAPVWVVAVTTLLFFANLIAGMGGLKAKALLALMAIGFIANALMVLYFTL